VPPLCSQASPWDQAACVRCQRPRAMTMKMAWAVNPPCAVKRARRTQQSVGDGVVPPPLRERTGGERCPERPSVPASVGVLRGHERQPSCSTLRLSSSYGTGPPASRQGPVHVDLPGAGAATKGAPSPRRSPVPPRRAPCDELSTALVRGRVARGHSDPGSFPGRPGRGRPRAHLGSYVALVARGTAVRRVWAGVDRADRCRVAVTVTAARRGQAHWRG
jgi:hypothetical protein